MRNSDPYDRLDAFIERLTRAGWTEVWQSTGTWWMHGFQRKKAVIIVAVIGDRLRVFSPTNQKFQLRRVG